MKQTLPAWARRSLALFVVLLLGKLVVVALRALDGTTAALRSPLSLPVLLAEDLVLAGLWAVLDAFSMRALRGRGESARWLAYAGLAIYAASNVPVLRMFGTPLTFPILGATDVALFDSLRIYVTPSNVLGIGSVLVAALLMPRLLRSARLPALPLGWTAALAAASVLFVIAGFALRTRVPLRGLHRNVLFAIVHTTLLQRAARGVAATIEVPPLPALEEAAARDPELRGLIGAARDRDVLWVVLESTAARYLAPYDADGSRDAMPNLTRFARRGLTFDAIYAAYPESIKGLYSMLCAMVPAAHTTAARYTQARLPCESIGQRFTDAGYRTAMFHSGWFLYLGMNGIIADRGFAVRKDAGEIGGAYRTSFGVDEAATVREVLAFFDEKKPSERAFVMYLPITGHHPYHSPGPANRPQPFPVRGELDSYRNDLYLGDQALGALLDGLEARGRLDRMAVIVSGDHGEAFHQHEGNFGHTLHLYDENLRVPLFLVAPGITDRLSAARIARPGSVIDIAPTILELAGLEAPHAQGRSLLQARASEDVPRFVTDHAVEQLGLRHGPWKFIDEPETGRAQLYDLVRDPEEQRDVASQHGERVAQYRAHLRAWFLRQRLLVTAH